MKVSKTIRQSVASTSNVECRKSVKRHLTEFVARLDLIRRSNVTVNWHPTPRLTPRLPNHAIRSQSPADDTFLTLLSRKPCPIWLGLNMNTEIRSQTWHRPICRRLPDAARP